MVGTAGRVRASVFGLTLPLLVATVAFTACPTGAAAADPEFFARTPEAGILAGSGAGQMFPGGIAADPNLPGHFFVADAGNRIDEFTPWGEFVKAFGWKVNAANPEEKLQICTLASGCQKGSAGPAPGQLDAPHAVAVGPGGDVYVAEGANHRVQKFDSEGNFLLAWGGDVVAHGPDDSTNDEQQQLSVAASSGTFKLGFENPLTGGGTQETASLPFNAGAAEVKAALDALPTIGGLGGSVSVTGGPGDATGSSPYLITFEGNLGGDDVPQLSIDRGKLGAASIGGTLRCSSSAQFEAIEYRWLRNGVEIPGAETPSYTTTAADAGKSVQCQVTAQRGEAASMQAATPVYVAPPEGVTAPPVAPKPAHDGSGTFRAEGEGIGQYLSVGSAGGQKLICLEGAWSGATSFAYRWYRNGAQIAGATASTYTVTEADLATRAYFQCAVTASNAGTATTTEFSGRALSGGAVTSPEPEPGPSPSPDVKMEPPSNVFTAHQGGAGEICKPGDSCKAGKEGSVPGQFGGDRYVSSLGVSPVDGTVYFGDGGNERIEAFGPDGTFEEEIAMPPIEGGGTDLKAIAVDDAGNLHVAVHKKSSPFGNEVNEIRELKPHGPAAEFVGPKITREGGLNGLAVDQSGDVFAVIIGPSGGPNTDLGHKVIEFGPTGECLDCGSAGEGGQTGFGRPEGGPGSGLGIKGIATGSACGTTDVYTVESGAPLYFEPPQGHVKIFGPPPNALLCPAPEKPPAIAAQYAASVDTGSAALRAQINPRYWNDTTYYVEYGTSPCFEGGCEETQPAAPGQRLTTKLVNAQLTSPTVFLDGLSPATTYHYRFVAQSSGGGPVRGVGGQVGDDGAEGTFRTFASPQPEASCPNQGFRTGPSAQLPDCRAYEMVSPLDKENGDVLSLEEISTGLPATLSQSSLEGSRLAYGSYRSFGGAGSAPWNSQYIAARGEDGWVSHPISPERGRVNQDSAETLYSEVKALSPDLCQAWLGTYAEPALAPGAQAGLPNLYRREDDECGGPGYEAMTTAKPAHNRPFGVALRGVSADGGASIFAWGDNLEGTEAPDLNGTNAEQALYYERVGEAPRYACVLPSGLPLDGGCAAGTGNGDNSESHADSVQNAISADGERVFWTDSGSGPGRIYARLNADRPESAHLHGAAAGTGDLIGPATGTGNLIGGSSKVSEVSEQSGHFAVGQVVAGAGIPAGDKITVIAPEASGKLKLTLEKAAKAGGTAVALSGEASATVANVVTEAGAFAVGQEVSAANAGIAPGTTIVSVGATTLTLSAVASAGGSAVALSASSECTEADKACTEAVSAQGEALSGATSSRYWGASDDGSRVFFTTTFAGPGQGNGDLYEFDVDAQTTKLIAKKAFGVMGASEDGSRVYFASEEVLAGANPQGRAPVPGKPNLYLYEAAGESFKFVAGLATAGSDIGTRHSVIQNFSSRRTARVTPDGLHASFTSTSQPTGYDNTDARSAGSCGEAGGGETSIVCDAEVFLYDAEADGGGGKLVCASCNPSGSRPVGVNIQFGINTFLAAGYIPVWENNLYASRVLSDDGTRLFFSSPDALSPLDSNGVTDVYQWEAPGAGGCEEADPGYSTQDEGCISLISSGQSPRPSEFLDASPSGDDVFIATLSSLLVQDYGLVDAYDARVGGGFPAPPAPAAECEGEACQGTPEAPDDPTPASATFEGAGNVAAEPSAPTPRPCAKGKVRRQGKCVARKHKRAHKRAKRNRRAGR